MAIGWPKEKVNVLNQSNGSGSIKEGTKESFNGSIWNIIWDLGSMYNMEEVKYMGVVRESWYGAAAENSNSVVIP